MSLDLLHIWPLLLGSLGVVVASLVLALWLAGNLGARHPWVFASAAFLVNIAVSMALQPGGSLISYLVSGALLVAVPVALGSRRAVRLRTSGARSAVALAGGLLVGVGIGWLVLPLVLLAASLGVLALTR
jgi:hypothetical protein